MHEVMDPRMREDDSREMDPRVCEDDGKFRLDAPVLVSAPSFIPAEPALDLIGGQESIPPLSRKTPVTPPL